ncbi:MAG: hypothetical protein PHU23_06855 [Dehalococcoidales bacterium]|nr:hypothetical protein [Dehalococcoidales bacterium]
MRIRLVFLLWLVVGMILSACTPGQIPSSVPTQESTLNSTTSALPQSSTTLSFTPVPSISVTPKPQIILPSGMSAFYGQVLWGGKPQPKSTVIADTKPPVIVVPPWESSSDKYKKFTIDTSIEGSYVLILEPGEYYIGCTLQGSDYISYKTSGFVPGLFGVSSRKIGVGETVQVDLEANDWSISLISPGNPFTQYDKNHSGNTLNINTPTLTWQQYDWTKYDGKVGYYKVELGIIKDGYHVVLTDRTDNPTYSVKKPLETGEYEWNVRAFSSSGGEIAGTIDEFYFLIQ